ncbi:MAG TPA: ribonuclease Z, partial [Spirochaetia bacterium]|nr:ribonuclease Z [Spirochaetia bacterium]
MNMEAFVLGCGGMMPLPGRHLTSVLLRREGELFLFDCGEGTQVSIRSLNLKWKKIS